MAERTFARLRDWVEPAHPMVVKLHDDLREIYTRIRDKYQTAIDQAFEKTSQQIGFVVATALPFVFKVGEKGSLKGGIIIDGDYLRDTLFDRELTQALKKLEADPIAKVSAGTYHLYLFWFEALKLRLRRDWVEPAHFGRHWLEPAHFRRELLREDIYAEATAKVVPPEVHEPAHWFDPGMVIAAEELVLISVIDEVYPELHLADRVALTRKSYFSRAIFPDVKEPAHFRELPYLVRPERATEALKAIREILERF